MEKKKKVQSETKGQKDQTINSRCYLESDEDEKWNSDDVKKLEIVGGRDMTWTIKPQKNGKYYVVAATGSYLCTKTIYNTPQVCRKPSDDSEWEIHTLGSSKIGFRNKNGKYLRATKIGVITSVVTYHVMQDWETWTPIKEIANASCGDRWYVL